jgi:hypothetical protein
LKSSDACGSWQSAVGVEPQRDLQIHIPCTERNPTSAEVDSAVSAALVGLSDPWGDEDQFIVLFDRIQDSLACAFEIELPAPALAGRSNIVAAAGLCVLNQCPGIYYCGPGNSSEGWFRALPSGSCLNNACFNHDKCSFLACVSSRPSCYFSPQSRSTGCDDPLSAACETCLQDDIDHLRLSYFLDLFICDAAVYLSVIPRPDPSCAHPPCDNVDRNCQVDICSPQNSSADADTGCVTTAIPEPSNINGNCSDSFSCTSPDFCSGGACIGTTDNERCPENSLTDDDQDCRRDACSPTSPFSDPITGCVTDGIIEPNNVPGNCVDAYACTSPDYCIGGVCNGINQNSLCGEVPGDCVSNVCSPGTAGTDSAGCIALCNLSVCGPGLAGHCSGCVCLPP